MIPSTDSEIIALLMEQAPALYGFAYARLGDHHLSQDLVQDALLAAWKSWSRFKGDAPVLTWLTGILKHKILDHHRSHARKPTVSWDAADGEGGSGIERLYDANGDWRIDPNHGMGAMMQSPAAAAQNADLRKWITHCMEQLPARLRLLFTAREVDEMPVAEAARLAGVTDGSAAVMLTRARQALRLCLQESLNR